MKVTDLGELTGDILVFGGVYSNLPALRALVNVSQTLGINPQNVICTGDIVAYCADASACVDLIQDFGCHVLAGNCEKQLAQNANDCGCGYSEDSQCSLLSRAWYAHAQQEISSPQRAWMHNLPDRIVFNASGQRYGVVHGAASDISKFIWPTTPSHTIQEEITLLNRQIGAVDCVIAGHTGIAMQRGIDGVLWCNAGAIGMPANDGNPTTSYVVISDKCINNNMLSYDVDKAKNAMIKAGLTQGYHTALTSGFWPSEDSLPHDMRRNDS